MSSLKEIGTTLHWSKIRVRVLGMQTAAVVSDMGRSQDMPSL